MIIFLNGKEKYLLFQRYLRLKNEFHKKNQQAVILEFDSTEQFDLREFCGAISSGSGLFSEKKMVVVKDIFSSTAAVQKKFLEIIDDNLVAENKKLFLLVVLQHCDPSKGKLLDFLKRKARTEEFKILQGVALEKWIKQEVKQRSNGKKAITEDAAITIASLGTDLWSVGNLLDCLLDYAGDVIESKDVMIFGQEKFADRIFDLVDALGNRNTSKALEVKQHLILQGENEFLIFSMLFSQIRNLFKVREGLRKGMDQKSIAVSMKLHPFVVKKTMAQLRHYDEKKLKSAFQLASKLDLETKTSELEMKDALDYFIVKM